MVGAGAVGRKGRAVWCVGSRGAGMCGMVRRRVAEQCERRRGTGVLGGGGGTGAGGAVEGIRGSEGFRRWRMRRSAVIRAAGEVRYAGRRPKVVRVMFQVVW